MRSLPLLGLVGAALAAPTFAGGFSASGPGGPIPASGSGGTGASWIAPGDATALPLTPFSSTVSVPSDVTSITSVDIDGLAHTWIGDTMATLTDPGGSEHLLWVRPGWQNTSNFGNSGDFDGGSYSIVESGATDLPADSGTSGAAAGTYNQDFHTGDGVLGQGWTSGNLGIVNTPMSTIAAVGGTWTLSIYDWGGGDSGSCTGWTLNGTRTAGAGAIPYCFGTSGCPCGNDGGAGNGCANGNNLAGANLAWSGSLSAGADDGNLDASGMPSPQSTFALFFQGDAAEAGGAGSHLFDGLRCAAGTVIRLGTRATTAGAASFGAGSGDSIVGSGGAAMGDTRYYQTWYRNVVGPCDTGANLTNGVEVTYTP